MFRMMSKGMKGLAAAGLLFSSVSTAIYCQRPEKTPDYDQDDHHDFEKVRNLDPAYRRLLEGNKAYIEQKLAEDPNYFKDLSKGQRPKYLLIGCADSRVPPNELTGTGPGELFLHRNVANLVNPTDFNVNSVIQFAVEVLKVEHIIVMGHTQCGGVKASIDGQYHGMIDQWIGSIREIYHKYSKELDAIHDDDEKLRRLTEHTIKEQVLNLCKNQFVQKAWSRKQRLHVHGWICEVESGKIIDLQVHQNEWKDIKPYFELRFDGSKK